jgi:DNA invertase Pin-like site-specific DNA recombinase
VRTEPSAHGLTPKSGVFYRRLQRDHRCRGQGERPTACFNILATFAEFETDLLKLRTREGMAVARAKGKLKGKPPKLSARQRAELVRMHGTGEYTIADLMELFSVGRATVYRTLQRANPGTAGWG